MRREVDFLLDVHQKVINEWVKPGVTAGEVYDKYFNYFVDHGFGAPPASASHGIGILRANRQHSDGRSPRSSNQA